MGKAGKAINAVALDEGYISLNEDDNGFRLNIAQSFFDPHDMRPVLLDWVVEVVLGIAKGKDLSPFPLVVFSVDSSGIILRFDDEDPIFADIDMVDLGSFPILAFDHDVVEQIPTISLDEPFELSVHPGFADSSFDGGERKNDEADQQDDQSDEKRPKEQIEIKMTKEQTRDNKREEDREAQCQANQYSEPLFVSRLPSSLCHKCPRFE